MSEVHTEELMPHEFANALVEKVGGIEGLMDSEEESGPPSSEPEESESAGPIADQTGRLHDPATGKFVPKAQETEAETEKEPGAEVEFEIDDPELFDFLSKYDGDPVKALKAAKEAQSMVGRQGSELGELRQELHLLQQLMWENAQKASTPQAPILPPGYLEQIADDNPKQAAQIALETGNFSALPTIIERWKDPDIGGDDGPFEAALFVASLQNQMMLGQIQNEIGMALSAVAPQHLESGDELDVEIAKVVERHPDLKDFLPAVGEVINEMPALYAALEQGTPQERARALDTVVTIAKSRHGADTSSEAMTRMRLRLKAEGDAARREAAVVSAGRRGNATDQPTRADQFRSAFRAHLGLEEDES